MQIIFFFNSSHAVGVKHQVNLHIRSFKAFRFFGTYVTVLVHSFWEQPLYLQFHLLHLSQICCLWNAPNLCLSQLKTQLKTFTVLGRPSLQAFDPGKAVINVSQNWVTGQISQPGLAGKTSFDLVYFILWQHFAHNLQWTNYMAW